MGWVVIEEFWPCTDTDSAEAAGCSVTVTSRTELTATDTCASAGRNPVALTVMRYAPGRRSSRRNSPRSSLVAVRSTGESTACTTIRADGMRAPVASCTSPRSEPRGFWAWSPAANRAITRTDFRTKALLFFQAVSYQADDLYALREYLAYYAV